MDGNFRSPAYAYASRKVLNEVGASFFPEVRTLRNQDEIVSWMYVSRSLVTRAAHDGALLDIVSVSRQRNKLLGVTGCLMSARSRFAQMIEGPPDSVGDIRSSIAADHRHTEVITLNARQVRKRRFSGWSLSYAGPSYFMEQTMEDAITHVVRREEEYAVDRLLLVMTEFSSAF
jgi:hypothetical protein